MLPISKLSPSEQILVPPTAASSLWVLNQVFKNQAIDKKYLKRYGLSLAISAASAPFRSIEQLYYNKTISNYKITKPPIFILGHWRSGTTFLHELICNDPSLAYISTYQATFTGVYLGAYKHLFKAFMQYQMPKKRAGDNVTLNINSPQEEEFALGNTLPYSFYYFWYFPKNINRYFDDFVLFKNLTTQQITQWLNNYEHLIKKTLIGTQREQFISKNPPNTGRIPQLLQQYPDAKFIYLYRNPIVVYLSYKKFLQSMLPYLQFQKISFEELEQNMFYIYTALLQQYYNTKQLIPPANLIEIDFESLEQQPLQFLEHLYTAFNLPNFNTALPYFKNYLQQKTNYQKNTHTLTPQQLTNLKQHWGYYINLHNYSLPNNICIQ